MNAGPRPSDALGAETWTRAGDELVERLRDLIRIPSVNPPPPDAPDGELRAARRIADELSAAGLAPEIVEPFAGRGSVSARLRGDGSGGEPLLLLGHLDVVPAPPELWTHDPFAADVADGYVWGRGAVDMKNLVAMEIGVVRLLAAAARDAGRDPASDPVPGLRRDVILTITADEEAGGHEGAGWIVEHRPEWLRAAGGINESGAVATTVGGQRFYPIGVAERGYAWFRITVRGTWGHASVPRDDNAAVLAGRIVAALGMQGSPDPSPVMTSFFAGMARELEQTDEISRVVKALAGGDPRLAEAGLDSI
ncbi:MAG TPA: M20/M25/M40 family metallo-hydrolase, partial [Candidatus Limnocylindrales bacterium]